MGLKAIGVVRKIDELGRVVIPMEIRKTQKWAEGQPMEVFMDGDALVLKAYGKDAERQEALQHLDSLLKEADTPEIQGLVREVINYVTKG